MKHRLCLDQCDILPKLIKDGIVLDQHEQHHIETIDVIQERLKETANKRIIDDFLADCSLNSILEDNETRKQSIIKNFTTTISQIFENIESELTQYYNSKKRTADTLISLLPEYNHDKLSQIQGDFSFLKRENIGAIQQLSIDQTNLVNKAKTEIDDFVLQIEKLLSRYQPATVIVEPMNQLSQQMEQVTLGEREGDGLQSMQIEKNEWLQNPLGSEILGIQLRQFQPQNLPKTNSNSQQAQQCYVCHGPFKYCCQDKECRLYVPGYDWNSQGEWTKF